MLSVAAFPRSTLPVAVSASVKISFHLLEEVPSVLSASLPEESDTKGLSICILVLYTRNLSDPL